MSPSILLTLRPDELTSRYIRCELEPQPRVLLGNVLRGHILLLHAWYCAVRTYSDWAALVVGPGSAHSYGRGGPSH